MCSLVRVLFCRPSLIVSLFACLSPSLSASLSSPLPTLHQLLHDNRKKNRVGVSRFGIKFCVFTCLVLTLVVGGWRLGSQVLGNEKLPSAIFASNDDMAAGVVSVAGRKGISVPETLSVTGFDDTPLAKILWPQLTTIKQPIYDMGYRAAELLIKPRKDEERLKSYCLEHDLIIRDSTAPKV